MMMKKIFTAVIAVLSLTGGAFQASAQKSEDGKMHFKPYGFIRNYLFIDSRESKALSEDIFYFIPKDKNMSGGKDLNAVASLNYQAITTRLGLDILGYKAGSTAIEGKIETDFYCLNSGGNTGVLRMRQAYINLKWDNEYSHTRLNLLFGQTWHPMAEDMPHGINLETGAPFNPFNRSAQITFNAGFLDGKLTATASLLEQLQYRSAGPVFSADGKTVTGTSISNSYQRYALVPELYVGLAFCSRGFTAKAGLDILTIKPRHGYAELEYGTNGKIKDRLTTVSPFLYAEYKDESSFQIKAKTIYAQAGEHLQLLSGYALVDADSPDKYKYSPLQQSATFVSIQYGRTVQGLMMAGYVKNFGTIDGIMTSTKSWNAFQVTPKELIFVSGNGYVNIARMFRLTPTVIYNLGRMQFGCEYNLTGVQYGDIDTLGGYGVPENDLHWVWNHRLLLMAKLNF